MIMSDPENEKDDPYELFSSPMKASTSSNQFYGKKSSSVLGKSASEKK